MEKEILTNRAFIDELVKAITAHAEPRNYDWWIFLAAIAGVIASLVVAYFAFQLNKKQITIATKQSEISEEQTAIAKKQSEIMEQQNKIALFDKRHKLISMIEHLASNLMATAVHSSSLPLYSWDDKIARLFNNMDFVANESNAVKLIYIIEQLDILECVFVLGNDDEAHIKKVRSGFVSLAINIGDELAETYFFNPMQENEVDTFKQFLTSDDDVFPQGCTLNDKMILLASLMSEYNLSGKLKKQLNLITPKN